MARPVPSSRFTGTVRTQGLEDSRTQNGIGGRLSPSSSGFIIGSQAEKSGGSKGSTKNNFPFWAANPSPLAALLEAQISGYSSLLAPCQPGAPTRRLVRDYRNVSCWGASPPEKGNLFLAGP